jgi:hypothetical protein
VALSGNYLSTGLGTITLTFPRPETAFAILWGSIDPLNTVMFNDATSDTVTGTMAEAAAGITIPGFTGFGGSAWFLIQTTTPFTTVALTSGIVSFESAAEAAGQFSTVPEPASLAMAGTGAGFVGLLAFRARRRRLSRGSV